MNKQYEHKIKVLNEKICELHRCCTRIYNNLDYTIEIFNIWRKKSDESKSQIDDKMFNNMIKYTKRIELDTTILKIVIELLK